MHKIKHFTFHESLGVWVHPVQCESEQMSDRDAGGGGKTFSDSHNKLCARTGWPKGRVTDADSINKICPHDRGDRADKGSNLTQEGSFR